MHIWVTRVVGRCGYACRSRGGWVWASLGRYGQRKAKAGRSGWVRLIRPGWVTWVVCGYACRSRGGFGSAWESLDRYGQRWAKASRSG